MKETNNECKIKSTFKTMFKSLKDNNGKREMFSKSVNMVVTTNRSTKNLVHVVYNFSYRISTKYYQRGEDSGFVFHSDDRLYRSYHNRSLISIGTYIKAEKWLQKKKE